MLSEHSAPEQPLDLADCEDSQSTLILKRDMASHDILWQRDKLTGVLFSQKVI